MSMTDLGWLRSLEREATTGPWVERDFGKDGAAVKDSNGYMSMGVKPDGTSDIQNARLIAVARNLLPALLEVLEATGSPDRTVIMAFQQKALAAIAAERRRVEGGR